MGLSLQLADRTINFAVKDLERIGAGGEGLVYALRVNGETFAIKRYHQPSKERFEKLRAAITAKPSNAVFSNGGKTIVQMAWPVGIVTEGGIDRGFAMPYVSSQETMELDFFISPILARDNRHLETPNLAMRLQIAQNLCSVINSLHETGHHFIDFKPQNIKVYPRSLHVCLIDCDSFSINSKGRRYPASAYSPQYINPVALVNDLHPSKLGEDQDNWAIAVALFMLLNFDLHPYDGKASSSVRVTAIDDFVRMGLYAYGYKSNPLVTPKKSSVHELWPREIRELFDRAFTSPQKSPQMVEWTNAIASILQNKKIARCEVQPNSVGHLKFLGFECMQCSYEARQAPRPAQRAVRPRPPYQPPQIPTRINPPLNTPKQMSGDKKLMIAIAGVVGLIILFDLLPKNQQQPKNSPQQSQQQTTESNSPGLVQLPSRKRGEVFVYYGNILRVPDETSLLNNAELRWCSYESVRLIYFREAGGIGKINKDTLARQRADFISFCYQKDGQEKTLNVKDADLIGIQTELKDGVLLTRLKQTYNLK
jgi:hypothetical protein